MRADRSRLRRFLRTLSCLTLSVSVGACAKDDEKKARAKTQPVAKDPAVARCEQGIVRAIRIEDVQKSTRLYFESCAALHKEPGCAKAWKKAATAPTERQMKIVALGCRKAYCDALGKDKFDLCKSDLDQSAEALQKAWPPFHDAILRRETGTFKDELQHAMLAFYAHRQKLAALAAKTEKKADASHDTTDGGVSASAKAPAPAKEGAKAAASAQAAPQPKSKSAPAPSSSAK